MAILHYFLLLSILLLHSPCISFHAPFIVWTGLPFFNLICSYLGSLLKNDPPDHFLICMEKNNRAITIMPNVLTNASIHVQHLVIIDMTLNTTSYKPTKHKLIKV